MTKLLNRDLNYKNEIDNYKKGIYLFKYSYHYLNRFQQLQFLKKMNYKNTCALKGCKLIKQI